MSIVKEGLGHGFSCEVSSQVINRWSPSINLTSRQHGILLFFRIFSLLSALAPDALIHAILTVPISFFFVTFGLIINEYHTLPCLLSNCLSFQNLFAFEKMHISIFPVKLTLHCCQLSGGFAFHKLIFLIEHLSPCSDLLRVDNFNFLGVFFPSHFLKQL